MFHFTKGPDSFSRFANELVSTAPEIRNLKKIGVDMEEAIFSGFKHHIPDVKRLLCVRHLSVRDEEKLIKLPQKTKMNQAQRNHAKAQIIKDIYGERKGNAYEYGLAEAFYNDDLTVKLQSLESKWEGLCPGFYEWFMKKRKIKFVESVIQSAREGTDTVGLYYQNDIESMHFVEKNNQSFKKLDTAQVVKNLEQVHNRQDAEEIRAIYGAGKYSLSTEFRKFAVDSAIWHSWSLTRKDNHIKAFRDYQPGPSDSFNKPKNAGRKPGSALRQRNPNEPDIVVDRNEENSDESQGIRIRLQKSPGTKQWKSSECSQHSDQTIRFQDPRTDQPEEFELHLRNKLSQSIFKCQGNCGKKITSDDYLLVKSYGTCKWTDKTGREQSKFGPMYIHFVDKCLKHFDSETFYGPHQHFDYSKIKVDKKSLADLSDAEISFLKNLGVQP